MVFLSFLFCALLVLLPHLANSRNIWIVLRNKPCWKLVLAREGYRDHGQLKASENDQGAWLRRQRTSSQFTEDNAILDLYWRQELQLSDVVSRLGLGKTNLTKTSDVVDTTLAALGAGLGLWLLEFLEKETGILFYAPPHAASAIIMLSGFKPPPANSVFLGLFGATFLSVAVLQQFGDNPAMRSVAVAVCLIWSKTTGALFPPAAALGALFFDSENLQRLGWIYPFFPCTSGGAVLYSLALALEPLRKTLRQQANVQQLESVTAAEREKTPAIADRSVEWSPNDDTPSASGRTVMTQTTVAMIVAASYVACSHV